MKKTCKANKTVATDNSAVVTDSSDWCHPRLSNVRRLIVEDEWSAAATAAAKSVYKAALLRLQPKKDSPVCAEWNEASDNEKIELCCCCCCWWWYEPLVIYLTPFSTFSSTWLLDSTSAKSKMKKRHKKMVHILCSAVLNWDRTRQLYLSRTSAGSATPK